jgi:hypothetical protein
MRPEDPHELQPLQVQAALLLELSAVTSVRVAQRLSGVRVRDLQPEDPILPVRDLQAVLGLNAEILKVCTAISHMRSAR